MTQEEHRDLTCAKFILTGLAIVILFGMLLSLVVLQSSQNPEFERTRLSVIYATTSQAFRGTIGVTQTQIVQTQIAAAISSQVSTP